MAPGEEWSEKEILKNKRKNEGERENLLISF